METEFITYEQALALKALGFDIPCFGYFDCERDFQFVPNKKKFLICEVARPTFSQSFKWFREKHDLHHTITKHITEYSFDTNVGGFKLCDTYEEAESACIDKLIEIVKSK